MIIGKERKRKGAEMVKRKGDSQRKEKKRKEKKRKEKKRKEKKRKEKKLKEKKRKEKKRINFSCVIWSEVFVAPRVLLDKAVSLIKANAAPTTVQSPPFIAS